MILAIIGIIAFLIIAFIVYRIIKVNRQRAEFSKRQFDGVKSLYTQIQSGQNPSASEILSHAENLLTREATFYLLQQFEKLELFPRQYLTIEKGAESNLAVWLSFPTELEACPDEIEYLEQVTVPLDQEHYVLYHVFKFRTDAPHWAHEYDWMLGVAGPYFDDSLPYDHPTATFSRLTKVTDGTPEEEANWVHTNIASRS